MLSTGRAWSAINRKGQLGGIRFDYAITCNGACVVDKNGTIVAEHPMTNEEMYALVDFCEDYNYPCNLTSRMHTMLTASMTSSTSTTIR